MKILFDVGDHTFEKIHNFKNLSVKINDANNNHKKNRIKTVAANKSYEGLSSFQIQTSNSF